MPAKVGNFFFFLPVWRHSIFLEYLWCREYGIRSLRVNTLRSLWYTIRNRRDLDESAITAESIAFHLKGDQKSTDERWRRFSKRAVDRSADRPATTINWNSEKAELHSVTKTLRRVPVHVCRPLYPLSIDNRSRARRRKDIKSSSNVARYKSTAALYARARVPAASTRDDPRPRYDFPLSLPPTYTSAQLCTAYQLFSETSPREYVRDSANPISFRGTNWGRSIATWNDERSFSVCTPRSLDQRSHTWKVKLQGS